MIFNDRLVYSAMLHKNHTYCNLLLVLKLREASVTLMTDILCKSLSLPQFSGNFVQLHFLLGCQHRQYRMTMLTGCNQLYSYLPLISIGLGVTWLKSLSTESLEECSEWLTSRPVVTPRDRCDSALAKGRVAELLIVFRTWEAKQRLFTSEASRLICPGHGLNGWWRQILQPSNMQFNEDLFSQPY